MYNTLPYIDLMGIQRLRKVASIYRTIEIGTIPGPTRAWDIWKESEPLACPPRMRSPFAILYFFNWKRIIDCVNCYLRIREFCECRNADWRYWRVGTWKKKWISATRIESLVSRNISFLFVGYYCRNFSLISNTEWGLKERNKRSFFLLFDKANDLSVWFRIYR